MRRWVLVIASSSVLVIGGCGSSGDGTGAPAGGDAAATPDDTTATTDDTSAGESSAPPDDSSIGGDDTYADADAEVAPSCGDTRSDPSNCGACGHVCATPLHGSPRCTAGACDASCDDGFHACAGACLRSTSVEACGSACTPCPVRAHTIATCDGASCGFHCAAGWYDCNHDPLDGCEADSTSATSCGACGVVCAGATPLCSTSAGASVCTSGCSDPLSRCGGSCVVLASDAKHCGACDHACPTDPHGVATCASSACSVRCDSGYHTCGGACVASNDVATCGSACTPCVPPSHASATCDGFACGFTCDAGFTKCGAACVPTAPCETTHTTCGTATVCGGATVTCGACRGGGAACTIGAACSDGSACVSPWWSQQYDFTKVAGTDGEVRGVVALASGDAILSGTLQTGSTASGAWVTRVDGVGKAKWTKSFGVHDSRFVLALPAADGGVIVGGDDGHPWSIRELDVGTGSETWSVVLPSTGLIARLTAGAVVPTGGYVFVGAVYVPVGSSSNAHAQIVRVDDKGKVVFQQTFGTYGEADSVVALADGTFTFAGWNLDSGGAAWLVHFDATGKLLWQQDYETGNYQGDSTVLALRADGTYALGGALNDATTAKKNTWLATIDASGKLLTEHTFAGGLVRGIVAKSDGTMVLSTEDAGGHLLIADATGAKVRELSLAATTTDSVATLIGTSDGGLLLGGHVSEAISTGLGTGYAWHPWAAKTTASDALSCP